MILQKFLLQTTRWLILFMSMIIVCTPLTAAAKTGAPPPGVSAPTPDEYFRGVVTRVIKTTTQNDDPQHITQTIEVRITSGAETGATHTLSYGDETGLTAARAVHVGDGVIIIKTIGPDGAVYYVQDQYRLPALAWAACAFFILIAACARWKGVASFVGLAVSLGIIVLFLVPQILAGHNPFLVSLVAIIAIAATSIYIAHGFSKQTTVAVCATLFTLGIAVACGAAVVAGAKLFGTGSEEAMYIATGAGASINLRGLLLGGILLGALGVLDDITTGQTAAVAELHDAAPHMTARELFARSQRIGREHIASLVNTLVLAYAGASLPLFLLLRMNTDQPLWVVLNSAQFAEEIARTLVGSAALVLAVPITSAAAAWWYTRGVTRGAQ